MTKTRAIVAYPKPGTNDGSSSGLLALRAGRHLVPHDRPDRETANGYLRLTARILLRGRDHPFSTIGVFSAREGEGRTTAAVNLAICIGRTRGFRGRVLLVDGDGRKRALTRLFCCDETPEPKDDGRPRFVGTQFEGVDLMTAPGGVDAMTLHDPAAWRESFADLSKRYTHIVVDCPPILDAPEGMILRDCVEELVLVVRAGETSVDTVSRALGSLKRRVLGVVLNGGAAEHRRPKKATA